MPTAIADPTDIRVEPRPFVVQPPSILEKMGITQVNPADQWLLEHRRNIHREPYVDVDENGELRLRQGLEVLFPGMEPLIRQARDKGVSDEMIQWAIRQKVREALEAGISDEAIEDALYQDRTEMGMFRSASEYIGRVLLPHKIMDYLSGGIKDKEYRSTMDRVKDEAEKAKVETYYADKRTQLVNEVASVVAKAFGAMTFGLGPLAMKTLAGEDLPTPETTVGTIAAQGANLAGFMLGPYRAAAAIWGSAAAPTAVGLRGVAEILAQGGARLGTATLLADAVPAFEQSDSLTEATARLLGNTATSTLAGTLFPVAGAIDSKTLRVAVGMAIADKMRAGTREWFTIDDVVAGISDGTIDKGELAERSFGYLLDLYFLSKTPSMKRELGLRSRNAMVEEMMRANPNEAEQIIVALGKQGLIPGMDARKLEGLNWNDVQRQFGGVEGFKAAYRALTPQQVAMANSIIQGAKGLPAGGAMIPTKTSVLTSQTRALSDAMKVEQMYNRSDALLAALHKGNLKAAYRELARLGWDSSANVKRELLKKGGADGKEAVIRHTLSRGANEKADYLWRKAAEEIYGDLSKADHILLDRIISSRRTLAIASYRKDFKFTEGLKADQHDNFLKSLPAERAARLNAKADRYFQIMREQLDQLKSEGLISQESYDGLVAKGDYARRSVIDYIDPEHTYGMGGRKITVRDSGIDSLKSGSSSAVETNSMLLMQEVIARTQARIMRNRANQALYSLAKDQPENGIVQVWHRLPKQARIDRAAKQATEENKANALKALQKLAAIDDGAIQRDGVGFNRQDTKRGNELAQKQSLTPEETKEAFGILVKYRRQLGDDALKAATGIGRPRTKTPPGFEALYAVVDGQPQAMLMPADMAKEWVLSDPMVNSQWTQIVGWLSGANILRPMATGYNPEFAVTNLPRDILHSWMTTQEWSSHAPLAAGQMIRDYVAVAKDAFTRTGRYADYIMEGGGMSFLTHQGRIKQGSKPGGIFETIQNYLGYAGETSELWTRLALRERAIRNGKPAHEATFVARNYLDFSQGGSFAKAVDSGIPYLSASIQGTRGIVGAAKDAPLATTYKIAQLGGLAIGLYYANSRCNQKCWDAVSDYDRANYFILTTPLTYTDETGQEVPIYFKIAKDQTQKVVYSMFEALAAKAVGDPVNYDALSKSAQEFAAIVPSANVPPTLDASVAYFLNFDLWYGEPVWKGPEVKPGEEWTPQTNPLAVQAGRALNLSPERMQRVVEQFATKNNIYTQLVGYGLGQIVGKLPEQERQETMKEILRQIPFVRRGVGFGNPDFQAMKENRDIAIEFNTQKYIRSRQLDALADDVVNGKGTRADAMRYVMQQPPEERERLLQRLQRHVTYGNLPSRAWWVDLTEVSPEAGATMYWARYEQADAERRKEMDATLMKLANPRIATERFMMKLGQLKQKGAK